MRRESRTNERFPPVSYNCAVATRGIMAISHEEFSSTEKDRPSTGNRARRAHGLEAPLPRPAAFHTLEKRAESPARRRRGRAAYTRTARVDGRLGGQGSARQWSAAGGRCLVAHARHPGIEGKAVFGNRVWSLAPMQAWPSKPSALLQDLDLLLRTSFSPSAPPSDSKVSSEAYGRRWSGVLPGQTESAYCPEWAAPRARQRTDDFRSSHEVEPMQQSDSAQPDASNQRGLSESMLRR